MPTVRQEAHRLVDTWPDETTWDDVIYTLHVRQAVEQTTRRSRFAIPGHFALGRRAACCQSPGYPPSRQRSQTRSGRWSENSTGTVSAASTSKAGSA